MRGNRTSRALGPNGGPNTDEEWARVTRLQRTDILAAVARPTDAVKALRREIKAAESELDAAVSAPVSDGRDPTESLPDELIVMIMLMLPLPTLWSGACKRVSSMGAADGERPDLAPQARGALGGVRV